MLNRVGPRVVLGALLSELRFYEENALAVLSLHIHIHSLTVPSSHNHVVPGCPILSTDKQTIYRQSRKEVEGQPLKTLGVSGAEQEYSLSKARVKHDRPWSPYGWLTVTC